MYTYFILYFVIIANIQCFMNKYSLLKQLKLNKSTSSLLPGYKTFYIDQQVDHFGFANNDSFKLRYLVCDDFWIGRNNPIFFYTGNEGDITLFYQNTGLMFDWASEFNALIVFCEHRYYGTSLPYGNDSFKDAQRLNYLTAGQALADFVHLLDHLKKGMQEAEHSPVIAFGGSYGGMLSAWIRMKYPFIVTGAVAASAPIWQFTDLTSCGDFLKLVTNDFRISGPKCDATIRKSWDAINNIAAQSEGLVVLSQIFGLCKPLNSSRVLKDWLVEIYTNLAMIDYPYPANFLEPLPAWPIKEVCKRLTNAELPDVDLLRSVRDAVGVYFNYTGTSKCYDVESQATASLGNTGWDYQACTEMVMPSCSDGVSDMFEANAWNASAYAAECWRKWKAVPRPDTIVQQFGGKEIQYASNIVFSNGLLDPWSTGGVLKSVSDSLVAVILKNGAHHLDLRQHNPRDPPDVVRARLVEKKYVKQWIVEHYQKVENTNALIRESRVCYQSVSFSRTYHWTKEMLTVPILLVLSVLIIGYMRRTQHPPHPNKSSKKIISV